MASISENEMQEIKRIVEDADIPWNSLHEKTMVITGATGLIGSTLVKALLTYARQWGKVFHLYLPVRNKEKAERIFADWMCPELHLESMKSFMDRHCSYAADYIIHAAAPTDSLQFIQAPADVIDTIYSGTKNLLELAKEKLSTSVLFLSTMEVYGTPTCADISEKDFGSLDPCAVRSSYPESKRLAECLCAAYASQHDVPVKVARLTQTFGFGVNVQSDQRVFAQFARSAIKKQDIVLHTKGLTERCYIDVTDAVRACLYILLKGENGIAYNVANPETYCSIYEMATMVANEYGIAVRVEESAEQAAKYCPTQKMHLNVSRLRSLGWNPTVDLKHSFAQLII